MNRVLLFFPSIARGGCEEYALLVARELRHRGYNLAICFPQVEGTRTIRKDLDELRVPILDWDPAPYASSATSGAIAREWLRANTLLSKVRPDRIWMVLPWVDAAVGFLAACGERGIAGLCVWQLATETVSIPPSAAAAARRSLACGLRWAAVSRDNRAFLARSYRIDETRVEVIHNGLLANRCSRPSTSTRRKHRIDVRRELKLPADAQIAITVARLCLEQKGQDILLKAIESLRDIDRTFFVWVGDGGARALLTRALEATSLQGRILLLGFRTDISRLLIAADLFILPSNLEGLPFSVLEAMASGCPVIATRVGGIPEILSDGLDAVLVPPRDVDALGRAIDRVISNRSLRQELSRRGYHVARVRSREAMLSQAFAHFTCVPRRSIGARTRRSETRDRPCLHADSCSCSESALYPLRVRVANF